MNNSFSFKKFQKDDLNDIINGIIDIISQNKKKEIGIQNSGFSFDIPKVKYLCDFVKKSISNSDSKLSEKKVIISNQKI